MARLAVLTLVALSVLLGTGTVAQAAPLSTEATRYEASCTFTADFVVDPGVTPTPSDFAWESVGDAPIDCTGDVNGYLVTGPGTYREWGTMTASVCGQGSGTGYYSGDIPTTGGMQHVEGSYKISYTGLSGTESGPHISATFTFQPTVGDCTTTPMTGFRLDQQQTLFTNAPANV